MIVLQKCPGTIKGSNTVLQYTNLKHFRIVLVLIFLMVTGANAQNGQSTERVAGKLYRIALEKKADKAFWHASRELIVLLDFYPDFSRIDGVLLHLGDCLYEMKENTGNR